MEVEETYRSFNLVGTLDVYALYQSIHLDLAVEALTDALITVTDSFLWRGYSTGKDVCWELCCSLSGEMAQTASSIQYTYWYGGPESGSIANIVVFSIVQNILLVNPSVQPLNMLQSTKRVLDDLFWLDWNSKTIQVCFEQGWNWVWDNLQRWCWEKCWFLGLHNYVAYSTGGHISTKMYVKNQQMLPDI